MRVRLLVTLVLLLLRAVSIARAQDESRCPEVENIPGNLVFNCSFEKGWTHIDLGEVGEGWWYFVEAGRPAFVHSTFERKHGNTAQQIWSDGEAFTAGIYQQVGDVVPGTWYTAEVVWAAVVASDGDNVRRMVGIDPFGGDGPSIAQRDLGRGGLAGEREVSRFARLSGGPGAHHHPLREGECPLFFGG